MVQLMLFVFSPLKFLIILQAIGTKLYSASMSLALESGLMTTRLAPLDKKKSISSGSALPVIPNKKDNERILIVIIITSNKYSA